MADSYEKASSMTNSINTNVGAMVALENLNATNSSLQVTQNRISTGLKVSSATDNGATWAVAQNERATVNALGSVQDSLNRGISTVDVAVSAGQTISDLLNQMKAKALAATDNSATTSDISNYANDFTALRNQIGKIVSTSDFNGVNMIKTSGSSVFALASASGSIKVTVAAANFGLGNSGGALATVTAGATFTTHATASAVLAAVNTAITAVNAAVAKLGTGVNALQSQLSFVQSQSDTLTTGIGNLVDADVAKESANLTALQTKQQLGVQALSIANSSNSVLLSLFQG
jgi:flagellin